MPSPPAITEGTACVLKSSSCSKLFSTLLPFRQNILRNRVSINKPDNAPFIVFQLSGSGDIDFS